MMRLFTCLSLMCVCSASAFAINKCTVDGQVTYTDLKCPANATSSKFSKQVLRPDNPKAAKKKHLANQKKLEQLRREKDREEQQHQRNLETQARGAQQEKNREFKCKELNLKIKSARRQEHAARLEGKNQAIEKARLQVQQAEGRYSHYCKS